MELHNWGHTKLGSMYMHCSEFDLISSGKKIILCYDQIIKATTTKYPMLNHDAVRSIRRKRREYI